MFCTPFCFTSIFSISLLRYNLNTMEKVHFNHIAEHIVDLLKQAKKQIRIAMAWFTSSELFNELIICLDRGVNVELILLDDAINWQPYAPDFNELMRKGGHLRTASMDKGFMHHKFCIIDGHKVITGSYNWTYYAETRNMENILISTEKETIQAYEMEYERLRNHYMPTLTAPRLSWEETAQCSGVDMDILNYEIGCITRIRELPQRKVFRQSSCVEIVEKRFNPTAAHNIGIQGENDFMHIIVPAGTSLPYTARYSLWNYLDTREHAVCRVVYGGSDQAGNNYLLLERELLPILTQEQDELEIAVHVTLTPSGLINLEIRCIATGKGFDMTTTQPELVHYE